MKIRRARLVPYRLPLVVPLATAHGRLDARRGWLLELEGDGGAVGRGDACPFPGQAGDGGFGMESWARCGEALREGLPGLVGESADSRGALLDAWEASIPDAPGARFAVDCALTELAALSASCSVAELLAQERGRRPRARVSVSVLIAASEADAIRSEAQRFLAAGFSTFKLKLGAGPLAHDLLRVRALREALGPAPEIRLDANGAWTREQAHSALEALGPLGIEIVEQPVEAEDLAGLGELRGVGGVRVAADEALAGPGGGAHVIARRAADCLVLKPAALGGLGSALSLAEAGAEAGIDCFVTHMLDSAFGVAAAAHLAAALPTAGPAHGLASPGLFAFDLAPPLRIAGGRMEFSDAPGWGLEPDPEAMTRASLGDATEFAA